MGLNNVSFRHGKGEGQSMIVASSRWGGALCAQALALLISVPVLAADTNAGMTAVAAEELDKRSKEAEEAQGLSKGMSDSSVRVLMTYAFSIIPEETIGEDGKAVKTDKSDPNKYFIPTEDARRVIRAATRSAYAEVCELPDLGRLNFETLMKSERARDTWSQEQLVMINALHLFSVSYFTGNMKVTTHEIPEEGEGGQGDGTMAVSKGGVPAEPEAGGGGETNEISSPAPSCPPDQKQKVIKAINAYAQSAEAPAGKQ